MRKIEKYKNNIIEFFFVCLLVFMVFSCISSWNVFLFDDNYIQWFPVINSTYTRLFETGKINIWEMHLMNGINILDTGIYSILNPFMLLSFIIYRFLGLSNPISIYIYIIVSLSMLVCNNIFKFYGICFRDRMALVFCILGCSSYYKLGNWYYVFNNLFIGSMLIYYFFRVDNKFVKYFFAGGVLGFSIYMGNVQYTLMWYMFFSIVTIVMGIIFSKKYLLFMVTNELTAMLFSLPQIVLNARASASSTAFSGRNSSFFDYSLHLDNILVRGSIPDCVINFFTNSQIEEYYFSNGFYFNGILALSFFIAILFLIKGRKQQCHLKKLTIAYMVAIIFFVLYTLGKGFMVDEILSVLPVINRFRYLHKAYFILTPLLTVTMLYVYHESSPNLRSKLIWTGVCLSAINLVHIDIGGGDKYPTK